MQAALNHGYSYNASHSRFGGAGVAAKLPAAGLKAQSKDTSLAQRRSRAECHTTAAVRSHGTTDPFFTCQRVASTPVATQTIELPVETPIHHEVKDEAVGTDGEDVTHWPGDVNHVIDVYPDERVSHHPSVPDLDMERLHSSRLSDTSYEEPLSPRHKANGEKCCIFHRSWLQVIVGVIVCLQWTRRRLGVI